MQSAPSKPARIGLIAWVAIVLTSMTLLAAGLLVYLIVTAEPRKPKVVEDIKDDPNQVAQEADDRFVLTLHKATLTGEKLTLEDRSIGEVIGGLQTADDRISWKLKLNKAGIYAIHYTYSNAHEKGAAPGKITFTCGEEKITAVVRPTGGVQATKTDSQFLKLEPVGEVTFEISVATTGDGEILALKKVELIPHLRERKKG